MQLLTLFNGVVNLYAHLAISYHSKKMKQLTVPPIDANCTPSETGKTANLGRGKLMSKEVEREREVVSR
jgi:hypothetical protein